MIGKTISHYRVTRQLGRGGMGVVYEAVDTKLDRTVALKFLPPDHIGNAMAKKRFMHEAKAASAIDHPNICTIHEIDETDDGHLFIAMARYEGRTLKELIDGGPLPVASALDVARQIAEGLERAHEREIVHRDIKPANILVTGGGLVKIVDFGLAKLAVETRITMAGSTMGTPSYMSPEQAGGEDADPRTDVWSLGVVLYEMLAGGLPFRGDNAQAVIHGILEREPAPLAGARPDLPEGTTRIIDRCLAKDRDNRYPSMSALLDDLRLLLGTASIRDLDATLPMGKAPAPSGRLRSRPVVMAVLALVAVVAGVLTWPPWRDEPQTRTLLAVMPYATIGPQDDAYFAEGISDAVHARLTHLRDLGVISRQSAASLRDGVTAPGQIGKALGIDYVLEGTVQRGNAEGGVDAVMVRTSLVRTGDETVVWSETFTEPLSGVFALQAAIAERVAKELDLHLMATARAAPEAPPTDNLEAYDLYLRGRDIQRRGGLENMREALRQYEYALALDGEFVEVLGAAAELEVWLYRNWGVDEGLARAEAAVAQAVNIDPENVATLFARAAVAYHGHRDFEAALEQYAKIREVQPGDSEVYARMAWVQRRMGRWDEAIANVEITLEMDPRTDSIPTNLAECFLWTRRFTEGLTSQERSRQLGTRRSAADHEAEAMLVLGSGGSTERARQVLLGGVETLPASSWEDGWIGTRLQLIRMFPEVYERVISRLILNAPTVRSRGEVAIFEAELAWVQGREDRVQALADTLLAIFEPLAVTDPDASFPRYALLVAHAHLGMADLVDHDRAEALRIASPTPDAYSDIATLNALAEANVRIGNIDAALDDLAVLLSVPSRVFPRQLELDPLWEPCRSHPRFGRLLASARDRESAP